MAELNSFMDRLSGQRSDDPSGRFSKRGRHSVRSVLKGNYREVWFLAYPAILTMMSQTIMSLVDMWMVGRLGTAELAAVGLAGTLVWSIFSFFNGTVSSVNTFVAQYYGAREHERCGSNTWQGLYLTVLFGIILALIGYWSGAFFDLMRPSPQVRRLGIAYTQIRLMGGGFFVAYLTLSCFFRGIGNTKTPMKVVVIANLINIVFDWILIFGKIGFPRLGVRGAAIATVFANVFAALALLSIFLSKRYNEMFRSRRTIRFRWPEMQRMLRIGTPIGVQYFLDMGSFLVFAAMIGRMGDVQLAASNISIRLLSLSFLPAFGISIAATSLVGQYIGSKDPDRAILSGYTAIKMGLFYSACIAIVFLILRKPLIGLFDDSAEVLTYGARILLLAAAFQLFDAVGIVSSGGLRGAGDTRWIMMVGVSYAWLLFVPLALLFGYALDMGVVGAWMGATIYIIIFGLTLFWRFWSRKWMAIKI
jgi:MATE family multidrug resistance protein